ncbi:hypothetical protein [Streptomyces sp. NPDC026092]|uniref:hypothetical protein n=1 Tax=Streptomyces sp. NPDC026092 TaxID=3154797 RepID=UPI0033C9B388
MHGRELARAAIRLLTEGRPATQEGAERQAKVRVLVEDRLSRGKLGEAALERLRHEPGEAAASIAAEVLADEIARDTAFAALLTDVVGAGGNNADGVPHGGVPSSPVPPGPVPPGPVPPGAVPPGPVPPGVPPVPPKPPLSPSAGTAQPRTGTQGPRFRPPLPPAYARRMWVILLLGLPQAIVTYVVLSVLVSTADGSMGGIVGVLYMLLLLVMAAGLATSVVLAVQLLRRFTSAALMTGVIIHSLLLLRMVLGAFL